jgi:hypothetical protein
MDTIKAFIASIIDKVGSEQLDSNAYKSIVDSLGMHIPDVNVEKWELSKQQNCCCIDIKYSDGTSVLVKQVQTEHVVSMLKTYRINSFVDGPVSETLQDTDWCVQGTLEECCSKMSIAVNIEFSSHKLKNWKIIKNDADNFQMVLLYVSIYDGPDIQVTRTVKRDDVISYLTDNIV